jgi:hypothetical protein
MAKIEVIKSCSQCKYCFSQGDKIWVCRLTGSPIYDISSPVPDWCVLEDVAVYNKRIIERFLSLNRE